ncbi:hypothetical protein E2C01_048541 [Portunus trituberculatus]|uniref:Uncharacterized protein n=1 Tax=Portunus trituberculatus TaxID=210409 RepID=A0A5B7GAI4_PORTR|nr:hypothetical protein [Portunus trituberculatus]
MTDIHPLLNVRYSIISSSNRLLTRRPFLLPSQGHDHCPPRPNITQDTSRSLWPQPTTDPLRHTMPGSASVPASPETVRLQSNKI